MRCAWLAAICVSLLQCVLAVRQMLIPAYFYPGSFWDEMEIASGIAIMNPNNGPGSSSDANYVSAVDSAQVSGLSVVGYVYTSYGARSVSDIQADVDAYFAYYSVDGIFFDETTYSTEYLGYYTNISNYVYSKGVNMHVTLNPGMYPDVGYLSIANLTVVFEGSYNKYASGFDVPAWAAPMDDDRMAHLVYDTDEDEMYVVYNISCVTGAGYLYITSDQLSNPWDTLPPYFDKEVAVLSGSCGFAIDDAKKNGAAAMRSSLEMLIAPVVLASIMALI